MPSTHASSSPLQAATTANSSVCNCALSCSQDRQNPGQFVLWYQRQHKYSQYFVLGGWKQFMPAPLPDTLKYHGLAPLLTSITTKTRDSANPRSKATSREIPLIPRLLFGPTAITVRFG